jgi:signal transduction histidine kinase
MVTRAVSRYGLAVRRVIANVSLVDAAIAVALTLAAQVEVWAPRFVVGTGEVDGSKPILSATTLMLTASLAFRVAAPLAAVAAASAGAGVQGLLTTPTQGLTELIALVLVAYSVAARSPARRAALGAAFLAPAIAAQARDPADWAFALLVVGGAFAVGLAMHRRALAVRVLDRRARVLERERDQSAAVERARIARELHDIVSHRVTTMVVQAQAADALLENDPGAARRALLSIDEGGRAALGELRSLLGLLRTDGMAAERVPQPGLDELRALVDRTREAGVPAELRVEGSAVAVAPALGLTLYRIAQEALTNVVKHAGSAPAEVVVRYREQAVELTVADRGPGLGVDGLGVDEGRGHGLRGMRERVAVYGGSLDAGPRAGGGFEVVARLPVGTDG